MTTEAILEKRPKTRSFCEGREIQWQHAVYLLRSGPEELNQLMETPELQRLEDYQLLVYARHDYTFETYTSSREKKN